MAVTFSEKKSPQPLIVAGPLLSPAIAAAA